jgi:hypothetical protein
MPNEVVFYVSWPSGKRDHFRVESEPDMLLISQSSAEYEAVFHLSPDRYSEFCGALGFADVTDPMSVISWMVSVGDQIPVVEAIQSSATRVFSWSDHF